MCVCVWTRVRRHLSCACCICLSGYVPCMPMCVLVCTNVVSPSTLLSMATGPGLYSVLDVKLVNGAYISLLPLILVKLHIQINLLHFLCNSCLLLRMWRGQDKDKILQTKVVVPSWNTATPKVIALELRREILTLKWGHKLSVGLLHREAGPWALGEELRTELLVLLTEKSRRRWPEHTKPVIPAELEEVFGGWSVLP